MKSSLLESKSLSLWRFPISSGTMDETIQIYCSVLIIHDI